MSDFVITGYKRRIMDATGCTEAEAPKVENLMRDVIFHSTLDWQSAAEFNRGAVAAYELLGALKGKAVI